MKARVGEYVCMEEGMEGVCAGRYSGGDGPARCSEVSGGLGGEGLDAAGVTVFAEDVSVQGVAALVVPLREQSATVLQDTDNELFHVQKILTNTVHHTICG